MPAVRRAADVPAEAVTAGANTTRQVLIGPDVGPHFALRKFTIAPGGFMPPHHNTVEHEQYVLRGRATIGIGGQTISVGPDDVVFIPAGTTHWYRTLGDESFEFLCVVPNALDTITLVETG